MRAPVVFRWKMSGTGRFRGEGKTRDMSLAGIYIWTATCPPVDSIIQVDVIIPALFNASRREIQAEMKVLRVEHDIANGGRSGFSAVGRGFSLRDIPEQRSGLITDSAVKVKG